nr:hypothetical protein [Naumannella halotolerans]
MKVVVSEARMATTSPTTDNMLAAQTIGLRRPVRSEIQPNNKVIAMLPSVKAIKVFACT